MSPLSNENDIMNPYVESNVMLEPTPLSDAVHYKHLFYQQQRLGLLSLEQKRLSSNDDVSCQPNSSPRMSGRKRNRDKKKKRIQEIGFASHVLVHFSPFDWEDIETSWYTKSDLADFRKERKAIVKALRSAKFDLNLIDPSTYDLRGLEPYFSPNINKMMQTRRMKLLKSVLAEQRRQKEEGITDPESIRNISCSETEWARERGKELGNNDAQEMFRGLFTATKNQNSPGRLARRVPQAQTTRSSY